MLKRPGDCLRDSQKRIDCEKLEHELRSAFPEITWVSAQLSGTRLLIRIRENEAVSQPAEDEGEPADLVAAKDGVITSMIVRSGRALVSIGDQVEKGQLLVEGALSITDDGGQEVRRELVRADADVVARRTGI